MNSLPHGGIPFGWRDHLIALRWLGLLYRRPRQFRDDLSTFSPRQQLVMAFWLLVHSAPYVFVLSAVGSLLGRGLTGSEIRIEDSAFGIAFGIGLGIAFGIASGIAYGIGSGTALRIATGFGSGIFGGIFVSIFVWNTRGIAAGTAAGISFGIALVVSSTRIYYHLVHLSANS